MKPPTRHSVLTLNFNMPPTYLMTFEEMARPADYRELIERIDRWLFGKQGSLAKSVKAQSRPPANWKPLSQNYVEWKKRMKATRTPIAGELPPNTVVSTKIWVRTGKVLEFLETHMNGRFKKVVIKPENLLSGKEFYQVFVDKLDYWVWADTKRPLATFTPDDEVQIRQILVAWFNTVVRRVYNQGN